MPVRSLMTSQQSEKFETVSVDTVHAPIVRRYRRRPWQLLLRFLPTETAVCRGISSTTGGPVLRQAGHFRPP